MARGGGYISRELASSSVLLTNGLRNRAVAVNAQIWEFSTETLKF